jgi:hypothetical protein
MSIPNVHGGVEIVRNYGVNPALLMRTFPGIEVQVLRQYSGEYCYKGGWPAQFPG